MPTDDQAGRTGAPEWRERIRSAVFSAAPYTGDVYLTAVVDAVTEAVESILAAEGSRSREGAEELIEARKEIARLRDDTHTCGENSLLPVERTGGCGGKILGLVFRCADCGTPFHRECLKKHFGGEIHAQVSELRATCAAQQERITALEQRASTAEGTLRDEVACTLEIYAALGIEWEVMVEGRAGQEAILRRILALREAEQRLQVSR